MFAAVGLITATGAFTTVEAERTATVDVAGDANALLALDEGSNAPDGVVSNQDTGEIQIDLESGNFGNQGAQGLNSNATTTFDELIEVQNQGTDNISLSVSYNITGDDTAVDNVILYDTSGTDLTSGSVSLSPGDIQEIGFKIETSDVASSSDTFNIEITFSAESSDTTPDTN